MRELKQFSDVFDYLLQEMPDAILSAGKVAMTSEMDYLLGQIPEYPAPPPNSTYRRTGDLGRKWTTQVTVEGQEVVGEIGTSVPIAPWVVGPDYPGQNFRVRGGMQTMWQAKVHAGRWWQFFDVMARELPKAVKVFADTFWTELGKDLK